SAQNVALRFKHLAAVTGLSALASLINPYGYHLHAHIYRYLSDRFLMNHIDEFRSPNFHGIAQQCFAALLLLTIVALAANRSRIGAAHLLLIVFAAYSGLYASRNLPTSSILLTLVAAPILSQALTAGAQAGLPARMRRFFSRLTAFSQ